MLNTCADQQPAAHLSPTISASSGRSPYLSHRNGSSQSPPLPTFTARLQGRGEDARGSSEVGWLGWLGSQLWKVHSTCLHLR